MPTNDRLAQRPGTYDADTIYVSALSPEPLGHGQVAAMCCHFQEVFFIILIAK